MTRSPLILLTFAIGASLALAGCSAHPSATLASDNFDSETEALASDLSGSIPGFLPVDATGIRLVVRTDGPGAQLSWGSSEGITASYCTEGPIAKPTTTLKNNWWPKDVPADGFDCGRWMAFTIGSVSYAWDTAQ